MSARFSALALCFFLLSSRYLNDRLFILCLDDFYKNNAWLTNNNTSYFQNIVENLMQQFNRVKCWNRISMEENQYESCDWCLKCEFGLVCLYGIRGCLAVKIHSQCLKVKIDCNHLCWWLLAASQKHFNSKEKWQTFSSQWKFRPFGEMSKRSLGSSNE